MIVHLARNISESVMEIVEQKSNGALAIIMIDCFDEEQY